MTRRPTARPFHLALPLALLAPPALALQDCNSNGTDDALDLVLGTSFDCNANGVPDECDACLDQVTLIDFEGLAEGTGVDTQFAALGVTFQLAGSPGEAPVAVVEGGSPPIAFTSTAGNDQPLAGLVGLTDPPVGGGTSGASTDPRDIEVLFSPPVTGASLYFIDIDGSDTVTLRAFAGAAEVDTHTVSAGDPGAGDGVGTLLSVAASGITSLVVDIAQGAPYGFAIDDLSFTRPTLAGDCGGFFRIAQESAPGLGDFDTNVLGLLEPFAVGASTTSLYSYDFPEGTSYNGTVFSPEPDRSVLFLVESGEGLVLFSVHDRAVPDDADGGRAEMRFELSGDADGAALLVLDDPSPNPNDSYTGNAGDSVFTSQHFWDACCTDGVVLGSLDDDWTLVLAFEDVAPATSPTIAGLDRWEALTADGAAIPLALQEDRRVRIEKLSGPCPLSLVPDVVDLSVATGGVQVLTLDAGPAFAGGIYFVLGTLSGTQPGVTLGTQVLPLNVDGYFLFTLTAPGSTFLTGALGFLDGQGRGQAVFALPAGLGPGLQGLQAHHAFTLLGQSFVSNPAPLRLVP